MFVIILVLLVMIKKVFRFKIVAIQSLIMTATFFFSCEFVIRIYLEVSTAALMVKHSWQGLLPARRLGTQPAHPSHFSGIRFFLEGTRRNRRQLGPGASESVEKPETSSSVSTHCSSSSFFRKTESEPSDLVSGSGGSTLPIDANGALLPDDAAIRLPTAPA